MVSISAKSKHLNAKSERCSPWIQMQGFRIWSETSRKKSTISAQALLITCETVGLLVASLVPAQLDEIYQEYFSLVATLEADLLKKQKQWNDGEL